VKAACRVHGAYHYHSYFHSSVSALKYSHKSEGPHPKMALEKLRCAKFGCDRLQWLILLIAQEKRYTTYVYVQDVADTHSSSR
jgi:hypothetical protein